MAQEVTGLVIGFTYHPVVSSLNIIYYYLRQESPLPHTHPPPPPPPPTADPPDVNDTATTDFYPQCVSSAASHVNN